MVSKKDIALFIQLKADNNPKGLARELEAVNINPLDNFKDALIGLYNTNKVLFYEVLKKVEYNPKAGNYTTSMNFTREIKEKIKEL